MNSKILLIDDSPCIHDLIKATFVPEFEVLSAFTGLGGLEMAKRYEPDLVLLDVDLPDINGFDVCRHLRAESNNIHIAVVFLTSSSSVDEKVCGLQVGAMDFMIKPFAIAELAQRAKNAIRIKGLLNELPNALRWCPPNRGRSSGARTRQDRTKATASLRLGWAQPGGDFPRSRAA